jgi:Carboxypeptidase regulatory-like domain
LHSVISFLKTMRHSREVNVKAQTLRRWIALVATPLLILSVHAPAFSQGLFATATGTVTDSTKALIPGVTIKATAVDTGVVTTTITNEAGAYALGNLTPGRYSISASLTGFQTKTLTDVQLSQGTSSRYNIELDVSTTNTQVDVTIAAETILATQGASVGQQLDQ